MNVDLTISKSIDRANLLLKHINNGAISATHNAMKRASASAKTEAGRYAAAEYAINKSEFMNHTTVKENIITSSSGVANVSVMFAGHVLNLTSFDLSYSSAKHGHNVQVRVMRNGGKTTLSRAFVANIWGHTGVYERVGASRFPLHEDYGPSTAHMLNNEQVKEQMHNKIVSVFEERTEHEILRLLNGW